VTGEGVGGGQLPGRREHPADTQIAQVGSFVEEAGAGVAAADGVSGRRRRADRERGQGRSSRRRPGRRYQRDRHKNDEGSMLEP
jgi:hypothetical protein